MNVTAKHRRGIASAGASIAFAALALVACSPKHEEPTAAPASSSVPATVATVREEEPKCSDEPRTDENDKRPRCGGQGNPLVVAKKSGYRIDISGVGTRTDGSACVVKPSIVCDIDKPFSNEFCGGTLTHTPTSDKGGTFEMHVSGNGGSFTQSGSYTLGGPAEKITATYASTKLCAHAGGRTICLPPRTISATWTKVDDCEAAQ